MEKYQPSGKVAPISGVYFLIVLVTFVPLFAWLYAYAIWYCPFIYINFFITLGFGGFVGVVVMYFVIVKGKVRNKKVAIAFGLGGGLAAWYVQWAFWLDLAANAGGGTGIVVSHIDYSMSESMLTDPMGLWSYAKEINEVGVWAIGKSPVNGFVLSVVWIIEAAVSIGMPALITSAKAVSPFSETKDEWATEINLSAYEFISEANKDGLLHELKGDTHAVHALKKAPITDHHSIFTVYDCDNDLYYLTITNKTAQLDKNKKLKFKEDKVLEYILIPKAVGKYLLAAKDDAPLETTAAT